MAANKNNFDNAIPDGDRHGMSFGFEYASGPWCLDAVYIFEMVKKVTIENTVGIGNGTDIDGDYSGTVELVTLGLNYKF